MDIDPATYLTMQSERRRAERRAAAFDSAMNLLNDFRVQLLPPQGAPLLEVGTYKGDPAYVYDPYKVPTNLALDAASSQSADLQGTAPAPETKNLMADAWVDLADMVMSMASCLSGLNVHWRRGDKMYLIDAARAPGGMAIRAGPPVPVEVHVRSEPVSLVARPAPTAPRLSAPKTYTDHDAPPVFRERGRTPTGYSNFGREGPDTSRTGREPKGPASGSGGGPWRQRPYNKGARKGGRQAAKNKEGSSRARSDSGAATSGGRARTGQSPAPGDLAPLIADLQRRGWTTVEGCRGGSALSSLSA